VVATAGPNWAPTYSLTLVGSSAFESKDPWYIERIVPVAKETDYAAAQAVHRGLWVMANMGPKRTVRVWRGNVAVPIVLAGVASSEKVGDSLLDRLTVGALTLTSTRYIPAPEELDQVRERRPDLLLRLVGLRGLEPRTSSLSGC
jgi:hypothetical protein